MTAPKPVPFSREDLKLLLEYNEESGILYWKPRNGNVKFNNRFAGKPAGCITPSKYINVYINGKSYKSHRIIWKMIYGIDPYIIDHIDGDPANNRLINLRNVTYTENTLNVKRRLEILSGRRGVYWKKSLGKWEVCIIHNKIRKYVGVFTCLAEAVAARVEAEKAMYTNQYVPIPKMDNSERFLRPTPSEQYLRTRLEYNSEKGTLRYLETTDNRFNEIWAGKDAFKTLSATGYYVGMLDGVTYSSHRIIWKMCHGKDPEGFIDHINGDILDNRILNLRDATHKENSRNKRRKGKSLSRLMGETYRKDTHKWRARIRVDNMLLHLGTFDTEEEAIKVRIEANNKYGFDPNHGKRQNE